MVAFGLFNPLAYLDVAESLAADGASEADLRTAVNRTYYAVFLTARETLGVEGSNRIHGRVIGELRRHDRFASLQLDALLDLRVLADYDIRVQDPFRTDWRSNYELARRLASFIAPRIEALR